ncbi:autotransporter-associated beta strand repeat-containing protein [Brucella sp. HL-2]|nr:autotransporter-associated beta strand repeat-containing protein [Brucella sp. HL-2]MCV9907835.1 autotransporter-associated beta strand repeat-containing protein [Brucella sp. HL-2]
MRASTAMSCVLAAITTIAVFFSLTYSAAPVLAQQVSGQGGAGGQHAISRPRAGGSGAAAISYSGGGGGGGGGKNSTSASEGIGGRGGSGPKAWGGGIGGRWNEHGNDGTKGANGLAKGWIWAPGNFGHDGGSGGGGGGGGVKTTLASSAIYDISTSIVGGKGGGGGNGAIGGIGYSAAIYPFSAYWDGTGGGGGAGGGGGGGGAALTFRSSGQGPMPAGEVAANISANITGGAGGDGGYGGDGGAGETKASMHNAVGGDGGSGGSGGNGGAGILADSFISSIYLTPGTAVAGGNGGKGGSGGWGGNSDYANDYNLGNGGNGGDGGVGGTGIVLGGPNADQSHVILGDGASVRGGQGGEKGFEGNRGSVYKGTMSPSNGTAGHQGNGGQGVWLNSGNRLRVEVGTGAVIQGGDGAVGGVGIDGAASQSLTSVAGTVSGGLGSGGARAAAVSINGTNNVLQLLNGFKFIGGVNLGADATLSLAGVENSAFDLSQIGGQFQGLSHLLKIDQSTWTLSGKANARFKDVGVSGGVVALGPDQSELQSDNGFIDGGKVTVTGNGTPSSAKWAVEKSLVVGNINTGSLEISNGGIVKVGKDLVIGGQNSVSGTVNLTGPQSNLTADGILAVGDSGQGTLTITNGAQVQSGKVAIGRNTGSTGSVFVTGVGTKWTARDIYISGGNADNDGGRGSLTIADGAVVGAPRGMINIGDNGAYGILNIGAAEGESAVAPGIFVGRDLMLSPFTDVVFNHNASDYSFDASISGFANLKFLSGKTKLTGDSSFFNGNATVTNSTLDVAERAKLNGTLTVNNAGRLEGSGQVGTTIINAGGVLAPTGTRSLTINGGLTLNGGGSIFPSDGASLIVNGKATFNSGGLYTYSLATGGSGTTAATIVNGDVALNGTMLNVTGSPSIGYHRIISYTGNLTQTNGGLNVGQTPDTTPFGFNYMVDTTQARAVDLLVSPQGLNILQQWDGGAPGSNNQNGVWNNTNQNWLNPVGGTANTTWGHGYAIFRGLGGTVTIDSAQSAVGLQFAGGNFRIEGNSGATLNLTGYSGSGIDIDVPEIRVLNNEGALISASISGTSGFEKTGDGLLVLWGDNTYSGNTYLSGGILQIASMQNLGSASNTLNINNATLRTADSFDLTQAVTLGGVSTINVLFDQEMKLTGGVSGDGMLFKDGGGTLLLSGSNSWSGGTWVNEGTLRLEANNSSAIAHNSDYVLTGGILDLNGNNLQMRSLIGTSGEISIDGATLTIAQGADTIYAGTITGNNFNSNLVKTGSGMLVLSGANSYWGNTTINGGSLAIFDAANLGINSSAGALEIRNAALLTLGDIDLNHRVNLIGTGTINTLFGTTLELSGAISGPAGALYKDGAGRLIISGNGTYAGGTKIAGGILQIGDGGTTGSITGNISNDSLLAFNRSDTFSYDGSISGAGALLQAGTGTTVLTGNHSYTGNTFITDGTLQIGNGGAAGSIGGYVLNNGKLAFNRSDDYTFSGLIIGTGALVKAGSGTLILDADNYYTSGTNIENGTLQIGNGGTSGWITGNVANNGTLAFNRSDTFEFSGKISGSGGFQQKGGGAVILTGDSSYTGATDVLSGRLAVNGSIGSSMFTTVYEGAELGGAGIVGQTFINGGTLAPGNSIGTLNVAGDLRFTASSLYEVEVSPSGSDRVNVAGQADLGGATVHASFDPGAYVMKRYNILNARDGLAGSAFGEEVTTNLPENFVSLLRYDASNAFLDLEMNIGGLNVNQQNVSAALVGYFDENGQIPFAFGALDADGLAAASGELATAAQQTTIDAMSQFMNMLADPLIIGQAGRITQAPASDTGLFENRWSVWGAGYGSSRTTDGDTIIGSHDARGRVYGVAVGADYHASTDTILGFAVAGGGTKFGLADGMGNGESDLFQAGIYGRQNVGNAYITGALAYGWQSIDTERTVSFYETDQLNGSYRANSWSGRLEAGYRFETPWLGVTPYAAGQFVSFDLPSYSEKAYAGSDTYALSYASQHETVGRSELGFSLDKSLTLSDGVFTTRGRLAWARNINNDRSVFAAINALPGAGFIVNGASQPKDVGLASVSAEMNWNHGLSLGAAFDAEFSGASTSYAGKGVLRYKW